MWNIDIKHKICKYTQRRDTKKTVRKRHVRYIYTIKWIFCVHKDLYDAKQPCCTKYKDRRMETQDHNHWLNTEFVNEMTYDGWNDIRANKQRAINGNRKWNMQTPICAVHSLKQYHRQFMQFANQTQPIRIQSELACLPTASKLFQQQPHINCANRSNCN